MKDPKLKKSKSLEDLWVRNNLLFESIDEYALELGQIPKRKKKGRT